MSHVDRAVWIIESRFRDAVSLDEVARETGLSKYHLSRLFALTTGRNYSGYLRGRRLSEAAKALALGASDILGVALDAGYASHEAFTRAFRDQFGVTPESVRAARTTERLLLLEPLRMTPNTSVILVPPRLETLGPFTVIGIRQRYDSPAGSAGIPDQWQRFQPYLAEMAPNSVGEHSFGVIIENDDEASNGFDYMCAIPMPEGTDMFPELDRLEIPRMRVAKFEHKGHISQIGATCEAVFSRGLLEAGLKADGPISMFEAYGADFDPMSGTGSVGIWIHIAD